MKKITTLIQEAQTLTSAEYAQMFDTSADFPKNKALTDVLCLGKKDECVCDALDFKTAFTAVFCREIAKYFTTEKISVILDANYSQSHYVIDADKDLNLCYISFVYSEQNKRAFQCSFRGNEKSIKLDACCTNSRVMREKFATFANETKFKVFPKYIAYRENLSDVDNIKTVVDEFKKALDIIKCSESAEVSAD